MPRKSNADLSLVRPQVDGRPTRLGPPAHLNPAERRLFLELVNGTDAKHFRPTDIPLLSAYVQASCLNDKANENMAKTGGPIDPETGAVNPWLAVQQRAVRMMTVLCTRLKLSPQSRMNSKTAARSHSAPSYYEQMRAQEEGNDDDE